MSQISTYLHPALRKGFRHSENMTSAKEMIKNELKNYIKDSDDPCSSTSDAAHVPEAQTASDKNKKPGILDFLKQRSTPNANSTASAINILKMYWETGETESSDDDAGGSATRFWDTNKHLSPLNKVAYKYLAVPTGHISAFGKDVFQVGIHTFHKKEPPIG